jgi:predicted TIM-barrel fold metal-dependent hydrolase
MKLIGLEEHFATKEVIDLWRQLPPDHQDVALGNSDRGDVERRLMDLAEERVGDMRETDFDVQVLSLTAPGLQNLEADAAVAIQGGVNDLIADTVRGKPDRYQGFATLATPEPEAAGRELERAVGTLGLHGAMLFGRTRSRNLDDPANTPIFEAAAAMRAPLYLHPQSPLPAVRAAIYSGLGDKVDAMFATAGIGWHYETGIQIVRLVLAGVFDRFPDLQIVTGHWGEVVLFYLERIDELAKVAKLERSVTEYFRTNVSVTPSGIWSQRYLRWASEVLGVERILFSTDYPYRFTRGGGARRFLDEACLSADDREAIAHGNWERMAANIKRS